MTGLDEGGVARLLFQAAVAAAGGHRRDFKPGAEATLRSLTADAAHEVLFPKRFGDRSSAAAAKPVDERLHEAEAAVTRLVDGMAGHALGLPGYEADKLGERTLSGAISSLCPCWPIC